jgi:hypothetical protein
MWCDYVAMSLPWTNSPRASERKETKRTGREEAVVMELWTMKERLRLSESRALYCNCRCQLTPTSMYILSGLL